MRKVFLSTVLLQEFKPVPYASRDLDLHDKQFKFPISYLLDDNITADDEIVIITGMNQTENPKKIMSILWLKCKIYWTPIMPRPNLLLLMN